MFGNDTVTEDSVIPKTGESEVNKKLADYDGSVNAPYPWLGLVFVCAMILLVVCVVVVIPLGSFWELITTPTADRSPFMLWLVR